MTGTDRGATLQAFRFKVNGKVLDFSRPDDGWKVFCLQLKTGSRDGYESHPEKNYLLTIHTL